MKILNSGQMREIDRRAIEEIGIPGSVLMENAGIRIAEEILKRFPFPAEERIVVVAGRGNNGGDGFVVARHLANRGARPVVLLLADLADLKGDAALQAGIAARMGIEVIEASTELCWKKQKMTLAHATLIVDAIFGTGLAKPAEGLQAAAIADLNKAGGFKVAVDLPSGLSADSAEIIGPAVRADLTVALAALKIAHVFPPAAGLAGELVVADIGIPPALFRIPELQLEMLEPRDILPFFKPRRRDGHKGTYGHLAVVAGSLGKTGAAGMTAKAALRTGAGLVTVGTPARCLPLVARTMLEIMTEPLPETAAGAVSAEAVPAALRMIQGKNAVVLGPGLTSGAPTAAFLLALLPKIEVPVVLDADGLNILAGHLDLLKRMKAPAVLTPHPGEFARLTGRTVPEVMAGRLDLVPQFARAHNVHLVLKGYRTLIAAPNGRVFVNPTGNPGMATGGSGDVLSGILGSLIVQEKDFLGAILASVYIHGLSGDLAASRLGERALVAGDLIRCLPAAVKALETGKA